MWSSEKIRHAIIFPQLQKYPRDLPAPSLINIACGGCTLLNLALHLSKFARVEKHRHVRRMPLMGACALQGVSGAHEYKKWASQHELMSSTPALSSQTIMVP